MKKHKAKNNKSELVDSAFMDWLFGMHQSFKWALSQAREIRGCYPPEALPEFDQKLSECQRYLNFLLIMAATQTNKKRK